MDRKGLNRVTLGFSEQEEWEISGVIESEIKKGKQMVRLGASEERNERVYVNAVKCF